MYDEGQPITHRPSIRPYKQSDKFTNTESTQNSLNREIKFI